MPTTNILNCRILRGDYVGLLTKIHPDDGAPPCAMLNSGPVILGINFSIECYDEYHVSVIITKGGGTSKTFSAATTSDRDHSCITEYGFNNIEHNSAWNRGLKESKIEASPPLN